MTVHELIQELIKIPNKESEVDIQISYEPHIWTKAIAAGNKIIVINKIGTILEDCDESNL